MIDTFHNTTQVQRFAHLFAAPGVFHCGGGTGPQVFDTFGALVRWVEDGEAGPSGSAPDPPVCADPAPAFRGWLANCSDSGADYPSSSSAVRR